MLSGVIFLLVARLLACAWYLTSLVRKISSYPNRKIYSSCLYYQNTRIRLYKIFSLIYFSTCIISGTSLFRSTSASRLDLTIHMPMHICYSWPRHTVVPRVRRFNINRMYFARDIVRRIDAKIARVNLLTRLRDAEDQSSWLITSDTK